eukprot:gene17804-biopygen18933
MRGKTSPPLTLASGVPQGSVLGPILFALSVCDLKANFTDIDIVQYADDCTLVIPVSPGEDTSLVTKKFVQRFVDYCAANRIAAEPDKTQLLHVRAKRPQDDVSFEHVKDKLLGRWYARSADFEVPNVTVGADLVARFDDGTEHAVTADAHGNCALLGFTVSSTRGRRVYWRNSTALIKWTRYVHQPEAPGTVCADADDDDIEPEEKSRATCKLGGQEVTFKDNMKILGMIIDNKLSWRQHCQTMAAKTRRAIAVVRRASRHLMDSDRVFMIQSLALPYVTYNQEVFGAASQTAKAKLVRAYNACAREAAWTERTAEALAVLGWPTYDEQQQAAQTKVAVKIATHKEPVALYRLLRRVGSPQAEEPSKHGGRPGMLQGKMEHDKRRAACEAEKRARAIFWKRAKEELIVLPIEQRAYDAELRELFRGNDVKLEANGAIRVWTDGSSRDNQNKDARQAGAGVFYGDGQQLNAGFPVTGQQTNQRAELTAVIECIRHDARKLLISARPRYCVRAFRQWIRRRALVVPLADWITPG